LIFSKCSVSPTDFAEEANDILLFVCVLSKEKVKQLTIGDQVTITNVKYFADDFGGHATYENMKNEKPK